jgi:hypothetical protein
MKYKYLEVKEKARYDMGKVITRKDVSLLNKKGIETAWDEMETTYNEKTHSSGLIQTNQEKRCF